MSHHGLPNAEELAQQLIAAYDRGETCPPATAEALRSVLPPNPSCPSNCPYHPVNARRYRRASEAHCFAHAAEQAQAAL